MDADQLLDEIRPAVLVIDGSGVIHQARGGFGGFLGHDVADLVGLHVFDLVWPSELEATASYLPDDPGGDLPALQTPIPFETVLRGGDGRAHQVDVLATGVLEGGHVVRYVLVLTPIGDNASAVPALDAELSGAPRSEVKRLLAEELSFHNPSGWTQWAFVDVPAEGTPVMTPSELFDPDQAAGLQAAFDAGWEPWNVERPDTTVLSPEDLPAEVLTVLVGEPMLEMQFRSVELDGRIVAGFIAIADVVRDGRPAPVRTNVAQRLDRLARIAGLLLDRWAERDRMESAALTDPVTGLANRTAFDEALGDESATSALFIDIDHFKDINDRYGHAMGDEVLRIVAERIRESCRPTDVVARIGGDELAVLLTAPAEVAVEIGERIVQRVAEPLGIDGGPDRITVSVGCAVSDGADSVVAPGGLVGAADHAMLQAKRRGRGRLVTG